MKTTTCLLALALLAAACGTSAGRSPAPTPRPSAPPTAGPTTPPSTTPTNPPASTAPSLVGRQFLSVSVTQDGAPRPLVPGTRIRLTFRDSDLGAQGGCNSIGGTYRIDDGKLVFEGGHMTEMACDDERMAQDDWLLDFLTGQPAVALDGDDLVLTTASTTITLLDAEVAEPDRPLVGTTWTLSSLITGGAVSSVPAGVVATIEFDDAGRVMIKPGCNQGGGSYSLDGDSITFTDLVTTEMACAEPAMSVEAAVLQVLSADALTFAIDAGSLTLMAGDIGLQFSAS